jgi:hypothetical protein
MAEEKSAPRLPNDIEHQRLRARASEGKAIENEPIEVTISVHEVLSATPVTTRAERRRALDDLTRRVQSSLAPALKRLPGARSRGG